MGGFVSSLWLFSASPPNRTVALQQLGRLGRRTEQEVCVQVATWPVHYNDLPYPCCAHDRERGSTVTTSVAKTISYNGFIILADQRFLHSIHMSMDMLLRKPWPHPAVLHSPKLAISTLQDICQAWNFRISPHPPEASNWERLQPRDME